MSAKLFTVCMAVAMVCLVAIVAMQVLECRILSLF